MMPIRIILPTILSLGLSFSAQAGFMDMIGQAAQVANAVRGQPVATPAPTVVTPAPTMMVSTDVMQGYAAMDCIALRGLESTLQQQLAVIAEPATPTAQVSKAAGLFGRASGLLGAAGAMAGVDTKSIQQATEISQHANQLASGIVPQDGITPQAADLSGQMSAIELQLQAKSCP